MDVYCFEKWFIQINYMLWYLDWKLTHHNNIACLKIILFWQIRLLLYYLIDLSHASSEVLVYNSAKWKVYETGAKVWKTCETVVPTLDYHLNYKSFIIFICHISIINHFVWIIYIFICLLISLFSATGKSFIAHNNKV